MILGVNRFFEWIGLKQKLHWGTQSPPLVSAGDIWWASTGENVGSEINGKSRLLSRPVIILEKLSHGFYFVIPTTTMSKAGSWFVPFRQADPTWLLYCIKHARSITAVFPPSSASSTTATFKKRAKDFGSSTNDIPHDHSWGRGKIPNVPSVYLLLPESQ